MAAAGALTNGRWSLTLLLPKARERLVEVELDQRVLRVPAVSALGEPQPLAPLGSS